MRIFIAYSGMTKITAVASKAKRALRNSQYQLQFRQLAGSLSDRTKSPQQLFGAVSDGFWFWLNTAGYRANPEIEEILPGMPDEKIQLRFTGAAGDKTLSEGFSAYTLFKRIATENLGDLSGKTTLDFGCGWGRIIRFWLKDIEPSDLWGTDCFQEMIEICQATNKWCQFNLNAPMPPSSFADHSVDFIYSYSVFSHLSEAAHLAWLQEFHRILKPGGLVIATTRPREFIEVCDAMRRDPNLPGHLIGAAASFPDLKQSLSEYDSGRFCHSSTGGGGVLETSFYGESAIPKRYVENRWTEYFSPVDFIDDRSQCGQNVIVVRKK